MAFERWLGTIPKRCELQLSLAGIRQAVRRKKAFHLGRLNMEFQQDCQKDKKITALWIFCRKTERIRSNELYGAALEGSTIFFCHSSLGCTSMESCQLADLKLQFSAAQDIRLKNYRAQSSFYRWPLSMGSYRDQHFYFNTAPWPVHHWKALD